MPLELTAEMVKEYGLTAGARVAGIAAAQDFVSAPAGFHPTDVLEGCRSVVVLGAPIAKEAILKEDTVGFIDLRTALSKRMDAVAKEVAKQIRKAGYQVKTVGGMSGKFVDGMQRGPISLKHAAQLAGLGRIGKNYLLNNPEYGNLLWFSAVLTDAELPPDPKAQYDFCGGCNRCTEACPAKALDEFAASGTLAKKACSGTMFKQIDKKWEIVCFQCRKVCPHCFGLQ